MNNGGKIVEIAGGGKDFFNFHQNGCWFCGGIEKEIQQIIQDFKSINIKKKAKKNLKGKMYKKSLLM